MEWLNLRGRLAEGWSRYFMMLLAGLLVSLFSVFLLNNIPVQAQDATWSGQSIKYLDNEYSPLTDSKQLADMGIPEGTRAYGYIRQSGSSREISVIYFQSGSDTIAADQATYVNFGFEPPDTYTQKDTKQISIQPAGENSTAEPSGCNISGIGWIVCPLTTELAKGMDWIYDKLTGFLVAQPLNITNTNSGLYVAWDIMRGFANAIFIVGFLVIIYSHISSVGISNYGIKKMLPRLIITAILVNISYYICAFAIDLSNVSGYALQDMFIQIRNTITTIGQGDASQTGSWESWTGLILAGGAATGAAVVGGATLLTQTGGTLSAAIWLLLPLLLGLLLTLIVVLLVLAARQALIVILTIISPLAFAAYILPGTEKWFEKWRGFFITMLIFFPAFSAVFGGSQLAAAAIMQNSSSIIMALLGLAVQVAPLAIAPLILKLSGGVLNRFAGIINNPNKGLIDRSRNFAKDQSQYLANKSSISNDNLTRGNFLRRAGRSANFVKRRRQERIDNYQKKADAAYEATSDHARLDRQRRAIEQQKQLTDKQLDINWSKHLQKDSQAIERDLKLRLAIDKESVENLNLENQYAELKTGHLPRTINPDGTLNTLNSKEFKSLRDGAALTAQHLAAQGLRKNTASGELNNQIAEQMFVNDELLDSAAGVYGEIGRDNALASAVATMRSEAGKSVESAEQLMKHFKVSAEQRQDLLKGVEISAKDSSGAEYTFKPTNSFAMEAALGEQMAVGTVNQVAEILSMSGSGGKLAEYRGSISEALAKSGVKGKAPFLGGKLINDVYKGEITGMDALQEYVVEWVAGGKFKPSDISIIDKEGLELLTKSINKPGGRATIGHERLRGLREKIDAVYKSQELMSNVADNATKPLDALYKSLP